MVAGAGQAAAVVLAGGLRMVVAAAAVQLLLRVAPVRLLGMAGQGLRELVLQEPLPLVGVVVAARRVALVRAAKFAFGQLGDRHEQS
jgi:hypothetical protein